MHKAVAVRSSIGRKKEFRIITTIENLGNNLCVLKRAAYPDALGFLHAIPYKTAKLAEATRGIENLSVPQAKQKGDVVWFDFIDGTTLDEEFAEAMLKRDGNELVNLFGEVIEIIDKLNTTSGKLDSKAILIFGDMGVNDKAEMLECGYLDFNLDNFIRSESGLCLIDAEFKYDFGIPKQHILNRLVISYLSRYSNLTGTMASEDFPVLEIGRNLFVPKIIWDVYGTRFKDLTISEESENIFQKHHSYSKGIDLGIFANDDWRIYTRSLFRDVASELSSLRSAHKVQVQQYTALSKELEETQATLEGYRNHWLIRRLDLIKKFLIRA